MLLYAPDSPPQIDFNTQPDGLTVITVTAPADKVGQLIGREGKIVKAVRSILNLSYPTVRYQIDFGPAAASETNESPELPTPPEA
jgi:predicted RNA-binding protein YlqC (UPF0109 family)